MVRTTVCHFHGTSQRSKTGHPVAESLENGIKKEILDLYPAKERRRYNHKSFAATTSSPTEEKQTNRSSLLSARQRHSAVDDAYVTVEESPLERTDAPPRCVKGTTLDGRPAHFRGGFARPPAVREASGCPAATSAKFIAKAFLSSGERERKKSGRDKALLSARVDKKIHDSK